MELGRLEAESRKLNQQVKELTTQMGKMKRLSAGTKLAAVQIPEIT